MQWHRLVVDECQQHFGASGSTRKARIMNTRTLYSVEASVVWLMSSTMILDTMTLSHVRNILAVSPELSKVQDDNSDLILQMSMIDRLMARSTFSIGARTANLIHRIDLSRQHMFRLSSCGPVDISPEMSISHVCRMVDICTVLDMEIQDQDSVQMSTTVLEELMMCSGVSDSQMRFLQNQRKELCTTEHISDQVKCPVCLDDLSSVYCMLTPCSHVMCFRCSCTCLRMSKVCPVCRQACTHQDVRLVTSSMHEIMRSRGTPIDQKYGAKIGSIAALLHQLQAQNETAVVFAQWPHLVREICVSLREAGVLVTTADGNAITRASRMAAFRSGRITALVLLLGDGISGIDLSSAGHVVLAHCIVGRKHFVAHNMQQAISRVCRLGQKKQEVTVHHFVANDTVEASMLQMW